MQPETYNIIKVVIAGTGLLLILIMFMVSFVIMHRKRRNQFIQEKQAMENQLQQQLLQSRIEIQEQTFQQIGKDLHDNVGQLLSTSRMLIGLTERELSNPPDTLLTANATLGQAIQEIRSLAKTLDKEWLERFSFSENMQAMTERVNAGGKTMLEYQAFSEIPLRNDEQIILFRIVQEAVQNAVKHASASHIRIKAEQQADHYLITVTDNGRGFDIIHSSKSMGLANMQHRTELLKGTISIKSAPQGGTTISIQIPFQ